MIRFKVVKASRLLLYIAVVALVAVLCAIAARYALSARGAAQSAGASLVQAVVTPEAEVLSAFASGLLTPPGDESPDAVEVVAARETPAPAPARSVLIYHTHTHEAYEQVSSDPYEAVEAWRTTDADHSVVRVGRELARCLRRLGFEVVHDATDHENDALSTAYTRSLKTLEGYDRPFDLYIDLHRDAYVKGAPVSYALGDGETCAQPMLLIGNGEGFDIKPHYAENLAFARDLTARINAVHPGLCKDVLVKDGRYNQHIGVFSVLIEVGHNRNTLREALTAVPFIADGIRAVFDDPSAETAQYMKAQNSALTKPIRNPSPAPR